MIIQKTVSQYAVVCSFSLDWAQDPSDSLPFSCILLFLCKQMRKSALSFFILMHRFVIVKPTFVRFMRNLHKSRQPLFKQKNQTKETLLVLFYPFSFAAGPGNTGGTIMSTIAETVVLTFGIFRLLPLAGPANNSGNTFDRFH